MVVLVLERESLLRSYVRAMLEQHGFQTLEAPDCPTALKQVRSEPDQISLLVTHIDALNGSPGIVLAQAVRVESPHMPVLFTSAVPHSLEELQLVVPGCRFLAKPFTAPALLSAVRELLEST